MDTKNKKYIIYGLVDPRTNELRYVGRSSSGLERPKSHLSKSRMNADDYCHKWIKKLVSEKLTPIIFILEYYDNPDEDANNWLNNREMKWIAVAKEVGCNLTNLTDGGGGCLGLSLEGRKKISDKLKGRIFTEEHKKKIRESRVGMKLTEEHKSKISNSLKGVVHTLEHRKKLGDSNRGIKSSCYGKFGKNSRTYGKIHSEETKKIMSERNVGKRKVKCIDDGKEFDSTYDADKYYNFNLGRVGYSARTSRTTHGLRFEYFK